MWGKLIWLTDQPLIWISDYGWVFTPFHPEHVILASVLC
jgi:hypothetical protein